MREMKESGIPWIGDIPAGWECVPIYTEFEEVLERNQSGKEKNALKFTYGTIVRKENFDADEDEYVSNTIKNYTVVTPGTIMLNGLNLNYDFISQRVAQVKERGVITSAYIAFRPFTQKVSSEYATYLFKMYDGCMAFHNMGGGVRKILNFSELKKQYFLLPPLSEQQAIADFLDAKCAEIDSLFSDIQAQIDTLAQYKKSVITEAVTKGLNPNAPMKDSGIPWIGDIPAGWIITKFKYIAKVKSNLVTPDEKYNMLPHISPENIEKDSGRLLPYGTVEESGIISGNHLFYVGQLLYSKIRPNLNKVVLAPFSGLCSADMYPIEIKNARFGLYMMLSNYFVMQVSLVIRDRVKMPKINQDELGQVIVLFPPLSEQQAIADFLDAKCAEIDGIIAAKEEQLSTLSEYKKSLIYEYVTGEKEVPTNE